MLRITNGKQVLIVSKGAFHEVFSHSGWAVVNNTPATSSQKPAEASGSGGGSKITTSSKSPSSSRLEAFNDNKALDEENTLKNMSEVELKQYASLLGIKTRTLKTREELMEAIQAHKK